MFEMYRRKILEGDLSPSCSRSTGLEQPVEFEIDELESHVCWWKKALYGLKQDTSSMSDEAEIH